VIFCKGARVPVRVRAEAATLAKSAVAYNLGTVNRAREAGVGSNGCVDTASSEGARPVPRARRVGYENRCPVVGAR
jgi:hypothetical protein